MSIIGKIHEITFYGLIMSFLCLATGRLTYQDMLMCATNVSNFKTFYLAFLFWLSVLYIPIAIIGAFSTKYLDGGEGLLFTSNSIVVIIFAHIAEELMGLVLTPFWFLKDLFTRNFTVWKIVDYSMYFVEIIFFVYGFFRI